MNRRNFLAMSILPTFYGCSSGPKAPLFSLDSYAKTVYLPPLAGINSANIGERMIATSRVAVVPAIELKDDVAIDLPYSDKYRMNSLLRAGTYLLFGYDNTGGSYYKSKFLVPLTYKSLLPTINSYQQGSLAGIHVSIAGITSVFIMYEGYAGPYETHRVPNIRFSDVTGEVDLPDQHMQKELIYSGISQSTITIRYREFWKGISRPDYFQEVQYDLSKGKAIGFREARFEILNASNTEITYRTTAHLK